MEDDYKDDKTDLQTGSILAFWQSVRLNKLNNIRRVENQQGVPLITPRNSGASVSRKAPNGFTLANRGNHTPLFNKNLTNCFKFKGCVPKELQKTTKQITPTISINIFISFSIYDFCFIL
ncbi:hypothetical protein PAEPH01_2115 [Pancytospora epiphaga]|nr:hypothetical protein PAEPH01_2115 [Pancytospora epiphaga]